MPQGLLKKPESVKSLADRNGVTTEYINQLIAEGMKVESEHSRDTAVQRTIATHHLSENIGYYKALKKMEKSFDSKDADSKKYFKQGGNIKSELSNTPAGGAIVSKINGKEVAHDDGSKGGIFIGRRHSEDGIKGMVEGSSPVEVETDEALIIPEAVNKPGKNTLDGKEMTTKEVLSTINQEAGGVPIKKAGGELSQEQKTGNDAAAGAGQGLKLKGESVIITRNAVLDDTKRDFNGEMLTNRQILSRINVAGGGAAFEQGGNIPAEISCGGGQFSYGGKMMYSREIAEDMNNSCGCKHSKMEAGGSTGFTKAEVLKELATIKADLPGVYSIAYAGQAPWRLMKYIQEQATGTTAIGDHVSENAYNATVRTIGNEELVKKCVALIPEQHKEKILQYINNSGQQVPKGLLEALDMSPLEGNGLNLSNIDKMILASVYQSEIDGKEGTISYLNSDASTKYYSENNLSKAHAISAVKNEIEELKDDIKFLYDNGFPYVDSKHDAEKFLRRLNELVKTSRGRELFGDQNPSSEQYYDAYLKVYDKLDEYFSDQFGELEYAAGGSVTGKNIKLLRDLKQDFLFMVGILRDEQQGKPSQGWDINLFKSSFYNKLTKLHKQDKTDELKAIFEYMAEIEKHFKLAKPVFTDKHKIWKLNPVENLEPETNTEEYPDRPIRMTDIPDDLKVWLPPMQIQAMVGNEELWEVLDRLTKIVRKMPQTYETQNIDTDDKIVWLHYFYGGTDWYIVEKDKGSKNDPPEMRGQQHQAFGYTILNQDYEMAEWGYISIEELKAASKWIELDFWFTPKKFGELKKTWEQPEDQPEQEPEQPSPVREKVVPRPGTFLYGANWGPDGSAIPAQYSQDLLTLLRQYGYSVVKLKGTSVDLVKDGVLRFYVNDNGGELNLGVIETGEHMGDVPYSIHKDGNDYHAVIPETIAEQINDLVNDYIKKINGLKKKTTLKLSSNMTTMELDQSKRAKVYFGDRLTAAFDDMEDNGQLPEGFQYFNDLSTVQIHFNGYDFHVQDNRELVSPDNSITIYFITKEGVKHQQIAKIMMDSQNDPIENLAVTIKSKILNWVDQEEAFKAGEHQNIKLPGEQMPESHITMDNPTAQEVAADPDAYSKAEATATESLVQMYKGKKQSIINDAIRALLLKKGVDRSQYSADELAFLKMYEGAGGLSKEGVTGTGLLDQFYTPMDICAKMWGFALKYGFKFEGARILEPAVGSGRFLQFIPKDADCEVTAYDIDQTAYTLCKVMFPDFDVRHGSFEEMFFKGRRHIGLAGVSELYDLVIGNPPYREYTSPWAPLGEKEATGAVTFEMYFIGRGIDVLKPGGLLIMIIPNTFMSNDKKYNDFKNKLAQKADLIDGARLPNGVFGNTEVGTDILVMRKK